MSGKTGLAGFESVKGAGAIWEAKQTGSKKAGNLQPLQPGDDSYIIGWYLGSKHGIGKNNSTIHGLKLKEVGNEAHIVGEMNDDKVNIWGSGVLDGLIAENNIAIGQCIAIQWKGLKKTKDGANEYHDWDVLINNSVEPLGMEGATVKNDSPAPSAEPMNLGAEKDPGAAIMEEEDDDLPF